MSIEHAEALKAFGKKVGDRSANKELKKLIEAEYEEMASEIEEFYFDNNGCEDDDEYEELPESPPCYFMNSLPTDDEVMSYDENGEVLSKYGDPRWYLANQSGAHIPISFVPYHNISTPRPRLEDPQAKLLCEVEKLAAYQMWPDKDPTTRNSTVATMKAHSKGWLFPRSSG
jgi:hypothetical protein